MSVVILDKMSVELNKGKGMFLYIVVYIPSDRSKHFTLHPPGRHVYSGTNMTSLGSILATHQLRAKTILILPPPSIARYSFIQ